jgi:cellulose biosynthesis protein BcsQ
MKPQQQPGRIVTFYSYKGGTGRSMALANFAWILAACGRSVVAIDWDLEAPGLHRYFRPFLVDPDLFESDGLIDAFWACAASAVSSTADQTIDIAETLDDARRRLDWEFPSKGYIDLIGAGRQGGTYSERVNTFDWKRFYELGGARFLTAVKDHLRAQYDWVLIDSRTGVSDTSGICTIQMPETVVACFTLNRQSVEGVTAILRSIRSYRSPTVDGSKIGFFPLATRIENAEKVKLEVARVFAREQMSEFLPGEMKFNQREYWDAMEIAYRPSYAFEEALAAFSDPTGAASASDTMLSQMEKMASRISGDANLRMPEVLESDRVKVLAKYAFGVAKPSGPSESAAVADGETADSEFLRNIRAKEQLWRSSDFDWQMLLSPRELDLLTDDDRKDFGRNMAYYYEQSVRMRRVQRSAQVIGWIGAVLALVITPYAASAADALWGPIPNWLMILSAIYLFLIVWGVLAIIGNVIVNADRPHGLTLLGLFRISVTPFQGSIQDYETAVKARDRVRVNV